MPECAGSAGPLPVKKRPPVEIPDITYIVSAYNRPVMLPVCLWSIKGQTHGDFNCYVADNSEDPKITAAHRLAVAQLNDARFTHVHTAKKTKVSDPYWAAEWVIGNMPVGRWLAFPCDDTYLVPGFGQRMLMQGLKDGAEFVYCQWILTGPVAGSGSVIPEACYRVWEMQIHQTAKTCFLIKRRAFERIGRFEGKRDTPGHASADYWLSSQALAHRLRISVLPEVAVVHN